ncbi:hypothetical protein K491DRAFT_689258 [Lophiostoma macrostomum CBS 122681]|uniref:Uncharacterized protein n=1 Tax=Lophiostoma macrostomum CBS 122681 TaxID=1314788 RepID=A0A6A6TKC6_9PLEO|nr:hypothetical protein K491DRAFT_689258 [Lophiostoma macrostomum CBS 122681]
MARKSSGHDTTARSSSKRGAPDKPTPTRQSKRSRVAAKTSYIEPDSDEDLEAHDSSSKHDENSDEFTFEDADSKDLSSEPEEEEEASEDDVKPKKAIPRGRLTKRTALPLHQKHSEKELLKPGGKLALGTQLIIKKPKARSEGDTPYADETVHPNTMLFLKDLAANNDRQWLKLHDPDYRASLQDFTTFLEKLSERVTECDSTVPELPVKDIIFRIYRDVRFSKDQTPYKTHFSAAWSRTGRKGPYAAYYVQIKPGDGSFVGGGLWCPEAQPLSRLRADIDRKPHKIKRILTDKAIRKAFLGGVADDEKKAVRAFTDQSENKSTALKKHPKGYSADHKDIELLRLRNFTLGTKLSDKEVVGANGLGRIADLVASMVPFVSL